MFPSTQSNTRDLSAALAASKVVSTGAGDAGKAFVKFDFESGSYVYGRDGIDITGDEIVVNTQAIMHGWTLWSGGKPTKVKAHFSDPLPEPPAPIGADFPAEARSFDARFEDDADTVLDFSTNSMGGRKGVDALLATIILRSAGGEKNFLYPVVELDSESYANAKRGGKMTYNPRFTIVDWVDADGIRESATPKLAAVPEVEAPEPSEDAPVEAPKKRRRKKA
jgi:hypothetical protein